MQYFLLYSEFNSLLDLLQKKGFTCIGPKVRDGIIAYDSLTSIEELPWGIRDKQSPGQYRLEKIKSNLAFAFSNGPQAIKPLLFKPEETAWKVVRDENGKLAFEPTQKEEKPIAIIGARACDIHAMEIQDKVFLEGEYCDPRYKERRKNLFIIGVNCSYSSANCFCVSAGSGPEIKSSYDILLTEIKDGFVIQSGSEKGAEIVLQLNVNLANATQKAAVKKVIAKTTKMQTKKVPFDNSSKLKDLLFNNLEHPRWNEVANRCLSCGNCTQVCPTCFCHSEHDTSNLGKNESEHIRTWDSCFTSGHSYIVGKVIRKDTQKRYRQWLTHKFGSWFDQFGTSGCVGCGRCITFCPVGIDVTEELAALDKADE